MKTTVSRTVTAEALPAHLERVSRGATRLGSRPGAGPGVTRRIRRGGARRSSLVDAELRYQLGVAEVIASNVAEGICAIDAEGRLTYLNPAGGQLLGYAASELLGRPMHEALHFEREERMS